MGKTKKENFKKYYTKTRRRKHKRAAHRDARVTKIIDVTPIERSILGDRVSAEMRISPEMNSTLIMGQSDSATYSPRINEKLVKRRSSAQRTKIELCDEESWLTDYKKPLKIQIGNKCVEYNDKKAVHLFLKNLQANKHINPSKVIAPKQSDQNCWFNTIFVAYFISDKGRKFFHFFRQCIIEGKTAVDDDIPESLKNAFAVLNYAIESCIFGSEFAYHYDSNYIIGNIYENLPHYLKTRHLVVDVGVHGNGFIYFNHMFEYIFGTYGITELALIYHLHMDLQSYRGTETEEDGSILVDKAIKRYIMEYEIPEIFVVSCNMELHQEERNKIVKQKHIRIGDVNTIYNDVHVHDDIEYTLDSCILRDNEGHHFAAFITCENEEYCFDGMSFRSLSPFAWKDKVNKNEDFVFVKDEDYKHYSDLTFNFRVGYQMLFYYRTK